MINRIFSKSKMKTWLEKLIKKHDKGRISANQLTLLALSVGILSAICVFLSGKVTGAGQIVFIVLSFVFLGISLIIDIFDGIVARNRSTTVFGGILDIFSDRMVEISVIIALTSTAPSYMSWAGIFSLGSIILCLTIFLLMGSINTESLSEDKKVIFYSRGIMERTETGIFLLIMIAIPIPIMRMILMWIFFGLVMITTLQRLYIAYRVLYFPELDTEKKTP